MTITRIGLGTLGLALAVAIASPGVSFAQDQNRADRPDLRQPDQRPQGEQPQDAQRRDQARRAPMPIEGQLKAVGTDKQVVLVDRTSGEEVLFYYDDDTRVEGESNGVQGLASQSGTMVRVTYRAEGQRAIAERIEVLGQSNDAERPSPPQRSPQQDQSRPGAPVEQPREEGNQP